MQLTACTLLAPLCSLIPKLSMRLPRNTLEWRQEREPGTNRLRMRKFNCRKNMGTEGNDAGRR